MRVNTLEVIGHKLPVHTYGLFLINYYDHIVELDIAFALKEMRVLGPTVQVHNYGLITLKIETLAYLQLQTTKMALSLYVPFHPFLLERFFAQQLAAANTGVVVSGPVDHLCILPVDHLYILYVEWRKALTLRHLIKFVNIPVKPSPHIVIFGRNRMRVNGLNFLFDV